MKIISTKTAPPENALKWIHFNHQNMYLDRKRLRRLWRCVHIVRIPQSIGFDSLFLCLRLWVNCSWTDDMCLMMPLPPFGIICSPNVWVFSLVLFWVVAAVHRAGCLYVWMTLFERTERIRYNICAPIHQIFVRCVYIQARIHTHTSWGKEWMKIFWFRINEPASEWASGKLR